MIIGVSVNAVLDIVE